MAQCWKKNIIFFCLVLWPCFFLAPTTFGFGGPSEKGDAAATAMEGNAKTETSDTKVVKKEEPTSDPQLAYIAVKGPEFTTKQSYPRSEILKVAMDEIIRTQRFELVFSSTQAFRDANYLFFELHLRGKEVRWGDGQKGFDLDYFLFNGKTGKLVTESHRERVFERHLQYTTRVMLYEVFYGKELAQKKAAEREKQPKTESEQPKKEENKDRDAGNKKGPKEKPQENDPSKKPEDEFEKKIKKPKTPTANPALPKTPPEIEIPIKKQAPKKGPPEDREEPEESGKPKAESNAKPATKPPKDTEKSEPKPPDKEEEPQLSPVEKPESNDRLAESIQEEIEAHIKRLKKKKKTLEDEIKEEEKKDDPKKPKENIAEDAIPFQLTAQAADPGGNPNRTTSRIDKTYTMGFDVLVQQVTSTDLITVNNTFTHIGFNGTAALRFDPKSPNAMKINLRLTQVVKSGEYSVPGMKQFGLGYMLGIPALHFYPYAGFEYETQSFVNLNTQGGGLEVNENQLLWYKGNGEIRLHLGWRIIALKGGMARTFAGSTNYGGNGKTVNIDGSRVEAGIGIELWQGAFLEFVTQQARMQSQGLSNLVNEQTTSYASVVMPL
ncbi:MAG: hypothetical protein A2X86_05295 [Bdellovibrionales bacterium GWA2_49_15]|nr:MAG: hypothetical protein A2X86_05295 [Bdellovibrionales bacterium GWA2_49_15]